MATHGGAALTDQHQQLLEVLADRPPLDEWSLHMLLDFSFPELSWGFARVQQLVSQLIVAGVIQRSDTGLLTVVR